MPLDERTQQVQVNAQALLEAFLATAPDATVLVNERGEIVLANTQAESMFGYARTELLGKPVEFLVPDRLGERHQQHRDNYSINPHFPVDIMLSPFMATESYQVIAVIRDMSRYVQERKRIESEISEMQHRLLDSQEAERQQLAQELHDGPLQELHSLDFGLVALARQLQGTPQQGSLQEMRLALQNISRHLRGLCQDLRPPSLPFFGVSAVIQSCAENFQRQYPALSIKLDLASDEQRLPERVRLALYRICQHALKNVAQHAEAHHVRICLQLDTDQVAMTIEDDGHGFSVPNSWLDWARQGRYGLIGCRERAEAIGGRFAIVSQPGQGVKVQAIVPLVTNNFEHKDET
jgi:PAS domain S-box-containing protein